jgi:hypothetical protein
VNGACYCSKLPDDPATSDPNPALDPEFTSVLKIAQFSLPRAFAASGLDFATVQAAASITIVVYYHYQ